MIDRIIDFSVRNKFIVFALVAVACIAGWWSMKHMTLDAIPDLSDTQVIIFSRWDRSPDIIEDQVTYPIVSAMVGAPRVKAVRGFSDFGYSYVYVIFEDGTDIYWARSRTQEYLSAVLPRLPAGRQDRDRAGCHARWAGSSSTPWWTSPGTHSLAELRSYQDWYLKYYLKRGARCGRGGPRRRVREAVPGERGPEPAAGLRPLHQPRGGGGAGRQLRVGGPPHRVRRDRVHGPGPGIRQVRRGPGGNRRRGRAIRARPSASRTSGRWWWGPTSAEGLPTSTARGTWSRASSSCGTGRTPWT